MKQFLLNLDPLLFEEIRKSAAAVDSTISDYVRRACKAHILLQKNHLQNEIRNVRRAKNAVEEKFWESAEESAGSFLLI